ncbi:MAG: PF20097 family protein [Christensenellales bacterium]
MKSGKTAKPEFQKECDCMKCPCCGNEMTSGIVQSARQIFFTTKAHKNWFIPDVAGNEEIVNAMIAKID